MYITIHCGGMPFDGNTINERSLGGSESAAYYMARELASIGHDVTLFTRTEQGMHADGVQYVPMGAVSEQTPLGDAFHHYAANTPMDVLIIQRHPLAFQYPWASKVNLLWLHDLASYGTKDAMLAQMPFVDGVLTVSEWHKDQVVKVWGLDPDIVMPIQNGVDLALYDTPYERDIPERDGGPNLLYTSRPERGLENLVKPGGIMERLHDIGASHHLYVCNYDNTMPQMAGYYQYLYQRCAALPNVSVLGHLTKQQLANVQRQCDICVYPTSFEETSCITAMECMAAGLPLLTSAVGALPETTEGSGTVLIDTLPNDEHYKGMELRVDGKADVDEFVLRLMDSDAFNKLISKQQAAAGNFAWAVAAKMLVEHVRGIFVRASSETGYLKQCLRNSDIYALRRALNKAPLVGEINRAVREELRECYAFMDGTWALHYEKYYEYEKQRGVNYGPENLGGNSRFEYVASLIADLPAGAMVLDYGCAHGHYTINLAKRFPQLKFTGIDITQSNIDKAIAWAADAGVTNVQFHRGAVEGDALTIAEAAPLPLADCVIAAEVLEHLESPARCADALCQQMKPGGKMIITVPYGPWEAQGYQEHWPWRAHVHHLEKADLRDLFSGHSGFQITVVPAGQSKFGEPLGSYVVTYENDGLQNGVIDYGRKEFLAKPRQTISLCMIAKNAEREIERCLASVIEIVDEVVLGIDDTCTDSTAERAAEFCADHHVPLTVLNIESPVVQGFDAARNETVDNAYGDWILWLDSDEVLNRAELIPRYLRNNQFNGYAIPQHHFTLEPAGVMKTDYPVRLFRNGKGIAFNGVVHEHPEIGLNEGVGRVINIPGLNIGHYGYVNESVRRGRFQRNIELLVRDRERNPNRNLGKFLWLRDLCQMCTFDKEEGRGTTNEMISRAKRGMEIFEEILEEPELFRMALDGLEFYSGLARVLGGGFEFDAQIDSHRVQGYFHNKSHLQRLLKLIIDEKVKDDEEAKYQ